MRRRWFRPLSLSTRVGLMVVVALVALAAALLTVVVSVSDASARKAVAEREDANMRVAWDQLHRYGDIFTVSGGALFAGAQPLNGLTAPVDAIKRLVGGTATIFLGDVRITTNVTLPNGERAVGTKLTPGPVYDTVLRRGEAYRGEADILGTRFFTAYDPIRGQAGQVLGILYVGIPAAPFLEAVEQTQATMLRVGGVLTVIIATLCLLIARRWFAPLHGLGQAMAALAGGERTFDLPWTRRQDEIGSMARALDGFRAAAAEKLMLEAEAARERDRADSDRTAAEAQRVQVAQQQLQVVSILAAGLERLAAGDLTYSLQTALAPDYEKLRGDFNAAVAQLKTAIAAIVGNMTGLTESAEGLARSADDLSRRTEQQAASLEQTAAALSRITDTVRSTAQGAGQARTAVADVTGDAERSGAVVQDAVSAMNTIQGSSEQISQIIGVIDEIAFQTNLLALNAGVEAARAGDAGRGFAVVASEVRMLAQRSATAAREIKALISASSNQIGVGAQKVEEAGASLLRIMGKVAQIGGVVNTIAVSAQDQAAALQEVSAAINQMDQITQQNAEMVQHSAAACHSLREDTAIMLQSTAHFQIDSARPSRAA